MADEAPETVTAATVQAEAVVIDAAAQAAQLATTAAQSAIADAAHVAAQAQVAAAERVTEIETRTAEAIVEQETDIQWLRRTATEQASALSSLSQRMEQTEAATGTALSSIMERLERLTPPPPVETQEAPVTEPETARQSAEGEGQGAAETNQNPHPKARHRLT